MLCLIAGTQGERHRRVPRPVGTGWSTTATYGYRQRLEEAAAKVQEEVSQAYAEAERALEMLRQEGEAEEMAAE